MKIFEPAASLRPYIKHFVFIESYNTKLNRLLPDTSVVAAIRLKGNVQFKSNAGIDCLPMMSVSGLRTSYRIAEYEAGSANLVVVFKEGGAAPFFDFPVHELFESNYPFYNCFNPSDLLILEEQVGSQELITGKVDSVQRFLFSKLKHQKTDLLVTKAVENIKVANGVIRIKDLADNFYISLDAFEKRFKRTIGATPKQFSNIVRMKSLIECAQPSGPLIDSALNAGFFDQSHFIRHFKNFTGQTPGEYFKHQQAQKDQGLISAT